MPDWSRFVRIGVSEPRANFLSLWERSEVGVRSIGPDRRATLSRSLTCFGLNSSPATRQLIRSLSRFIGILTHHFVNIGSAFTSFLWRRKFFENSCNRIARRGTYYLNVRCSLKSRLRGRESLGSSSNRSPGGRRTRPGKPAEFGGTTSYNTLSNRTNESEKRELESRSHRRINKGERSCLKYTPGSWGT